MNCIINFFQSLIAKRTQSLLDLRFVQTTTKSAPKGKDKTDSVSLNSYDMRLKSNLAKDGKDKKARKGSRDQIHSMEPLFKKSLGRNCVSMENLGVFVTEDAYTGNYPGYPVQAYPAYFYYNNPYQPQPVWGFPSNYIENQSSGYFNNGSSIGNSKQSIDDFRKYRDVAL